MMLIIHHIRVDRISRVARMVVLLSCLLFGCKSETYGQLNTDVIMTIGRNAMYYEDYALSIQYFNQVVQSKPHLYAPYYFRAIAKYYLGDYVGAIDDCSKAVDRDPYIADVYKLRAINYIRTDDYASATADYYTLLHQLNDKTHDVWYNLVLCESQLKHHDKADLLLDTMIIRWPDESRVYLLKAQVAMAKTDTLSADSLLHKALAVDSMDVDALSNIALLSLMQGKCKESEEWYDRVLTLRPRQTSFYVNRALARYQQDNLRGAMADYNAALEINPDNYLAHYNRALLSMQVGENNLAIRDFDFVLQHHPSDRRALYNRAILAQQTGDYERAIKDYTTIIEEFPRFTGAYVNRAYCYRQVGNGRLSEADERKAMDLQLDYAYRHEEAINPLDTISNQRNEEDIEDYDKLLADETESVVPNYKSEYRGLVQNKQVSTDSQPLFGLTFFRAENELVGSVDNQALFVESLNKIQPLMGKLCLAARETSLTDEQCIEVARYRQDVVRSIQQNNNDATLHLLYSIYLSTERDYEHALSEANIAITQGWAGADSSDFKVATLFLRASIKTKLVELYEAANTTKNDHQGYQYISAISDLSDAIEIQKDCAVFYYNRAALYAYSQNVSKAIDDYSHALELNPRMAEAYYNRGILYAQSDQKSKAIADLSRAGELGLYTAYSLIKHYRK